MKNERTRGFLCLTAILLLAMVVALGLTTSAFSDVRKNQRREDQSSVALAAIELSRQGSMQTDDILEALGIGSLRIVSIDAAQTDEAIVRQAKTGRVVWDEQQGQTVFLLRDRLCAVRTRPTPLLTRMMVFYISLMCSCFFICCVIADRMILGSISSQVGQLSAAAGRIAQGDYTVRVTPDKHATEQTRRLFDDFNAMAEALSSVEYLRRDFTQSVSHEIKTPVAAIHSYAQLMQLPGLPEEEKQNCARAIAQQTRRLSGLSDSLLRLTRLESRVTPLNLCKCAVGDSLQEATAALLPQIEQKGIELTCELPGVDAVVDEELFVQAYRNILENAVKFTPEGGAIHVSLRRTPAMLALTVSDTGCGMSKETCAHIFEKFYQADASHATQGVGLGLALVRRIVQLHGGEVLVESEPGKGSTFRVLIPQKA